MVDIDFDGEQMSYFFILKRRRNWLYINASLHKMAEARIKADMWVLKTSYFLSR